MQFTYDESLLSDLHKDARGFRPTVNFMVEWDRGGPDHKQKIWNQLIWEVEDSIDQERMLYARCEDEFAKTVQEYRSAGASDDVTAIRWMLDAEECVEAVRVYGAEYAQWRWGVRPGFAYSDAIRAAIDQLINNSG